MGEEHTDAKNSEEELKRKFKSAVTVATVQHMLTKLSTQCFHKCVARPQKSLDASEKNCITLCMERYVDSFNLVAKTYGKRLQRELKMGLKLEAQTGSQRTNSLDRDSEQC